MVGGGIRARDIGLHDWFSISSAGTLCLEVLVRQANSFRTKFVSRLVALIIVGLQLHSSVMLSTPCS